MAEELPRDLATVPLHSCVQTVQQCTVQSCANKDQSLVQVRTLQHQNEDDGEILRRVEVCGE